MANNRNSKRYKEAVKTMTATVDRMASGAWTQASAPVVHATPTPQAPPPPTTKRKR